MKRQTRSKTGVMNFKNRVLKDRLRRLGIERENIQLGRRVRRRAAYYAPGEIQPYMEFFDIAGQQRLGLHPGTHFLRRTRIAYTGTRAGDFFVANGKFGYNQTPAGYGWHHFHDWMPSCAAGGQGSGTLYLMTVAEHATFHYGGVAQAETHLGIAYG